MRYITTAFAANIRAYRKQNALTQGEFARMLNVTAQAVSKWESGKSLPDISVLLAVSEMTGCSIEKLFSEEIFC